MPKRAIGLRCTICNHPERPRIDLAVASGSSMRAIALRFKVSPDAVWRHGQAHLSPEIRGALVTRLLQREGDTRRILLEEGAGVAEGLKAIRGPCSHCFWRQPIAATARLRSSLGRLHENLRFGREVDRRARAARRDQHHQHFALTRLSADARGADAGSRPLSRGARGGRATFRRVGCRLRPRWARRRQGDRSAPAEVACAA